LYEAIACRLPGDFRSPLIIRRCPISMIASLDFGLPTTCFRVFLTESNKKGLVSKNSYEASTTQRFREPYSCVFRRINHKP
jgi:hypothetical protein